MAEEDVAIRIDAELGGNAAARLDELADKARLATADTERLQAALEDVTGPAPGATPFTPAGTPRVGSGLLATPAATPLSQARPVSPLAATPQPPAVDVDDLARQARQAQKNAAAHAADHAALVWANRGQTDPASVEFTARSQRQPRRLQDRAQAAQAAHAEALRPPATDPATAATAAVLSGPLPLPRAQGLQPRLTQLSVAHVARATQLAPPTTYPSTPGLAPTTLAPLSTPAAATGCAEATACLGQLTRFRPALAGLVSDLTAARGATEQLGLALGRLGKRATGLGGAGGPGPAGPPRPAGPRAQTIPWVNPYQPKPKTGRGAAPASGRLGMGRRGLLRLLGPAYNVVAGTMLAGFAASMVGGALQGVAKASDSFQNTSLTAGEKVRGGLEGIPLVGSIAKGLFELGDSLSGLNEAVRQSTLEFELSARRLGISAQTRAALEPLQARALELTTTAHARAYQQTDYGALPTLGNPVELAQWQRNANVARQKAEAKRQGTLAEAQYNATFDREKAADARLAAAQRKIDQGKRLEQFQNPLLGPLNSTTGRILLDPFGARVPLAALASDGGKVLGMGRNLQLTGYDEQVDALADKRKAQEDRIKAREAMANASSSGRKALIEGQKNELADLSDQKATVLGTYQAYGGMTQGNRAMALQAARQAKELGFGSLGQFQVGLLQQAGRGDYVKEQQRKLGEAAEPEINELRQLTRSDRDQGTKTARQLEQEEITLQNQINVNIELDAEKLASELAAKINPLLKVLEALVKQEDTIKKLQADVDLAKKNSANR